MIQPFRGTYDQLPELALRQQSIVEIARSLACLYGYSLISTPIFEYAEVFSRGLGDTSDVVSKEMFTFNDRHGDTLVLRPEGTAGIMRAVLSNKLAHQLPQKYFYAGPMFRYERPQKGRFRQFHQIGVEFIGESAPGADVEVIALAHNLLERLKVGHKVELQINSLGDQESRQAYRDVLVTYFSDFRHQLSEDSQQRLEKNPLRILDSKDPGDRILVEKAPNLKDYLNGLSQDFLGAVLEGLSTLKIPYVLNPHLVRGLDYYCHTAFEFVTESLGAHNAVLAGGRYDSLAQMMGNKDPIPSIGWAAGIERLNLMMEQEMPTMRPISMIPIGPAAEKEVTGIAQSLRQEAFPVILSHQGNLKSRMKYANRINAKIAILVGDTELEKQTAIVKFLDSGEQEEVSFSQLIQHLKSAYYAK
jgi:histidyl-tRNA synthetase